MNPREQWEEQERQTLAPAAQLSAANSGRARPEPPCPLRTSFQVDRDRILHCKSFRRLKHKTQVFLSPEGDHYRTRLTHTLEVAQLARTAARALRLNEDLAEAIALGHDLGHTPFGHSGEGVLDELLPGGFHHVRQSLRVVELLEADGAGLNLTAEVRDGILKHSKGRAPLRGRDPAALPLSLEGQLVRLADVIAYVNHDLDDALRAGLLQGVRLPEKVLGRLGGSFEERAFNLLDDLIRHSTGDGVRLSEGVADAVEELRDWLFHNVYRADAVHEEFLKASRMLRQLFLHFQDHPETLAAEGGRPLPGDALEVSIADFLAGMTDRYALGLYQRLFLPQPWKAV